VVARLMFLVCICPPLCLAAYVLYVCCAICALLPAINIRSFVAVFTTLHCHRRTASWPEPLHGDVKNASSGKNVSYETRTYLRATL